MGFSRTLTSSATAGLDLRIDYAKVKVVVGTTSTVEVVLSTRDADDSPAVKAIREATISNPSLDGRRSAPGALVATRDTYARVHVPDTGDGGGLDGITFLPGGGISASRITGGMSIVGNRVFINGREVRPGNSGQTFHGIEAEVRLPSRAGFCIDSDGANVVHVGEALAFVKADSTSGDLTLRHVARLEAESISGAVVCEAAQQAKVETTSGEIQIGLAGDVDLHSTSGAVSVHELAGDAQCQTVSGAISVTVADTGPEHLRRVSAKSISGAVYVRDPGNLYGRGLLDVKAKTVSGSVSAPGASARRRGW